ncbi:hypothetical protein [Oceanobacillus oncorhynchi]|uniref:hypothetical protein n=1 Tax=Oceanobacillus oncorhynchi TaxID=545501 RepID=UPI001BB40C8F|nr:hypothetical protein [Oceanobacillus oncorhynchi]
MGRVIAATVLIDRVIAGLNDVRLMRPLRRTVLLSDVQMFSMGRVIAVPGRTSADVATTLFDGASNRSPRTY